MLMKKKSQGIYIKVSPEELLEIRKRMEMAGIRNLSAYLLKMGMNGYIFQIDMSDMKSVLRLVQISSNNINQYAKKANATGNIYLEDINEIKKNQTEIIKLLGKLLDKYRMID